MAEKKGHFEKGRWIDDKDVPEKSEEREVIKDLAGEEKGHKEESFNEDRDIDKIIGDTAESVKKAVDSVVFLGNTLIGTKKGRKEIEKKAKKAGKKLLKSLEDAIEDAKKSL